MGPRSAAWQIENKSLDALAILTSCEDRTRVIILRSWNETGWHAVFEEACQMQDELKQLHSVLMTLWESLYEQAKASS